MKNFKKNFSLAIIIVLGLSLLTVTSLASASVSSYNNVQINIQTSSNMPSGYYTVSAYNMTGYQESSTQTYYPAASFELPNGQYIFTVTADNQTNTNYPVPLASGATSSSGNGASTPVTPILPIYIAPAEEYGYSVQQISNSISITITTQNVSAFPTNTLTIQVLYANGTAAAGASVSASTLGSDYYWGYESNVVTWTTTGPTGYATLVTPVAPEQIDAWSWLPLNLTGNPVPQVIIAGESVNVTGPMVPAYIGVAGSMMMIPPQTTAAITMVTQQQNYWITPYAATATPLTASTGASTSDSSVGPSAIPASVYAQQQGNPALQVTKTSTSTASTSKTTSGNTLLLAILAAIVIAIVAVASLMISTRTKRKQQSNVSVNP